MGKKFLSILACMLMTASMALAQKQITGSVVDAESNEPLIGVSVRVPDTSVGVLTDVDGKFSITLPAGAKSLNFSFMGMKPATLTARDGMKVSLETNTKAMDEVIVVAYGQQKKSAFTGSAAVVGADEIGKIQATNAVDAIKGKAAGVQIYSGSGQPGTTPTIRIRGFNSLIAGQEPLIVLDGSPFDGSLNDINPGDVESMSVLKDAASTALYGARGGNGVIIITTKTGKRNKDAEINFEAKWGSNMKGSRDYDQIKDPRGYYETYYQGLYSYATNQMGLPSNAAWQWANLNTIDRAAGFGLGYQIYNVPAGEAFIGTNGKVNPNAKLGNVVVGSDGVSQFLLTPDNWSDAIYSKGLRQQYTISASGASDKGTYYASADYLSNEGITQASDYKRLTTRLKADYMLKKWLKFSTNLSYNHNDRNNLGEEGSSSSGNLFALHNIAPIYPMFIRDKDGNILQHQAAGIAMYDYGEATSVLGLSRPYLGQSNPISDLLVDTRHREANTFNGSFNFDVYLPKGFTFTSINNVFLNEYRYTSVTNPYFGQYKANNGTVYKEHYRFLSTNFQQRLNWHEKFGKHDVELMAAHEYYRYKTYDLDGQKHNMFSQQNKELNGAVILDATGSSVGEYNTESWLFRGMYSFADRFYAQASVMTQASSAFHPDHRWGVFWSASFGWMISKENWFKAKWVDDLKFKVSYGENGNDAGLAGYYYTNRYTIVNSNNQVSLSPSSLGKNENFSWEKSGKFNIGFDFSLFKDRLYGGIEYYNNRTVGLISSVPYAPSFGYSSFYDNIGNMSNQGVELDLHGVPVRTKDLEWTIYANVTSNHNKITELADGRKTQKVWDIDDNGNLVKEYQGYSSGSYYYTEGLSRYTYYTKRYIGVYNQDNYALVGDASYDPSKGGMAMYRKNVKDADGNVTGTVGTLNGSEADYYVSGNVLPRVYGGFGTTLTYKGFDLSVDFQYQLGGKVYDSEYASLMSFNDGYGYHVDQLNAWTPENMYSNIPRLNVGDSFNATASDRFLTSASCLTLGNVTFGYTLPKNALAKIGINKVRVYVVGDNLYTWSARKGLNPSMFPTGSSTGLNYSPIRTISGGIQVGF